MLGVTEAAGHRQDAEPESTPGRAPSVRLPLALGAAGPEAVLALQRAAGNRAVGRMLASRGPRVVARLLAPELVGDGPGRLASPRFAGEPLLEACFRDQARMTLHARDSAEHQPVSKVQQALIELGYDLGPNAADGDYGPLTWEAVKAFKRDQSLGWEHMGDVGPGTMHRLDELFAAPTPVPTCGDEPVDSTLDPLPAVPPFRFEVMSQSDLLGEVDRAGQKPPKGALGASQPSFERVPFQGLPNQSVPVTVTAIPTGSADCVKCAADWTLPVAWRSLIASGPFVLDEAKRFFVSRAGDASGCPPRSLPRLLEVRELITPEALSFIVAGELEHYLDFVRAFRIVGGRYLANVRRLSPERTHLRARDASECEKKVQSFLVRAHGPFAQADQRAEPNGGFTFVGPADAVSSAPADQAGPASGDFELNFLKQYTEAFIDDFLALYLAPDRDREPDGPHIARPQPPSTRPPILPNIDRDINPFGCDAYCRKLTARSFPGIPGTSSEVLVKDRDVPKKLSWHVM